jgi:SPP1 family predicted phage head-tail adaptor
MRAARLCHRLILDRPESVRSATGSESINFVPFATVWAGIEPIKGAEAVAAGAQLLGSLDTKIVIRWSPNMDAVGAKWRARHATRTNPTIYEIVAQPVHVNLGQREIQLFCRSGVSDG